MGFLNMNVLHKGSLLQDRVFRLGSKLGFPTGRDSATFRDRGTEISSLSRDKGTTGQAQNFATGRDGTGF